MDSLRPDYVNLTHIHWDHFQSASLKRFPYSTPIIVPKGHYDRMRRDLNSLGFHNVVELKHAERMELGPDLNLTSYTFGRYCDSAVVFEGGGVTLLNLNDCKIMGLPLKHLLRRHNRPDFVFGSHSSANSRACFEVIDDAVAEVDDGQQYMKRFYQFVSATNARYAVPFASNQCYLHKDTFRFNEDNQTPKMVEELWTRLDVQKPQLKVMVSGDSWSAEEGFNYGEKDWFTNRDALLLEYQEQKAATLNSFYEKEARAVVTLRQMERFFFKFVKQTPLILRSMFKNHPIDFVLTSDERRSIYRVDLYSGKIMELDRVNEQDNPFQVHVPAYVMRHAMGVGLMAHLGIGKRITYRVTKRERKYAERLKVLFELHEYELLPLRKILGLRSLQTWALRWREVLLYANLLKDKVLGRKLTFDKQLVPAPSEAVPAACGRVRPKRDATREQGVGGVSAATTGKLDPIAESSEERGHDNP